MFPDRCGAGPEVAASVRRRLTLACLSCHSRATPQRAARAAWAVVTGAPHTLEQSAQLPPVPYTYAVVPVEAPPSTEMHMLPVLFRPPVCPTDPPWPKLPRPSWTLAKPFWSRIATAITNEKRTNNRPQLSSTKLAGTFLGVIEAYN